MRSLTILIVSAILIVQMIRCSSESDQHSTAEILISEAEYAELKPYLEYYLNSESKYYEDAASHPWYSQEINASLEIDGETIRRAYTERTVTIFINLLRRYIMAHHDIPDQDNSSSVLLMIREVKNHEYMLSRPFDGQGQEVIYQLENDGVLVYSNHLPASGKFYSAKHGVLNFDASELLNKNNSTTRGNLSLKNNNRNFQMSLNMIAHSHDIEKFFIRDNHVATLVTSNLKLEYKAGLGFKHPRLRINAGLREQWGNELSIEFITFTGETPQYFSSFLMNIYSPGSDGTPGPSLVHFTNSSTSDVNLENLPSGVDYLLSIPIFEDPYE